MIAACPKCHTRYRVQPEQLGADGARLRCSHCHGVFRVRLPPPQASQKASPASAQRGEAERSPQQDASAPARPAPAASAPSVQVAKAPPPVAAPPLAAPDPGEPGPVFDRERLVVVAHADAEMCKLVAEALERWGLQTLVAHDGVEAILSIQRALPRVVVLDAALPKMYGFQVCEVVKRNESLRETSVVLVGAVYKDDRYRRAPSEIYGADVYVEPPDLPDALHAILTGFGVDLQAADGSAAPAPSIRPSGLYGHVARGGRSPGSAPVRESADPFGEVSTSGHPKVREASRHPDRETVFDAPPAGREPRPAVASASVGTVDAREATGSDPLAAERAKAERLARIIVSDIALYNPEKFAAAARSGEDPLATMRDELEEGRALFRERIDASVRAERDHLAEELIRVVKARSGP